MHEEPERGAAVRIDEIEQLRAFFVDPPSAVGFKTKELTYAQCGFVARKILVGDAVPRKILVRDVNAAERGVFVDIPNDVRELKCQAKFLSEVQCARIAVPKNMRARETNSSSDTIAILAEAVEGRIGLDGEVHFRAGDQVVQIARGHVEATHGIDEGGENFPFAVGIFSKGRHCRSIK